MKAYMMLMPGSETLFTEMTERIALQGLRIEAAYCVLLTDNIVTKLYSHKRNEVWFPDLVEYCTAGKCYVVESSGSNVIEKLLQLRSDIRQQYAEDLLRCVVHAPDTLENAMYELDLFNKAERAELPLAPSLSHQY